MRLTNNQGKEFAPVLAATSFIHPWMVILNAQPAATYRRQVFGTMPAVILFATHDVKQYRRLRVWLRWWRHQ